VVGPWTTWGDLINHSYRTLETAVSESHYVDTICVSYTQTEIFALKKIPGDSKSVQMFNLHLQVYKFGWDTKEQKCKLVDVDPNKSPSTFLSTYVDLQEAEGNHSTSVRSQEYHIYLLCMYFYPRQ